MTIMIPIADMHCDTLSISLEHQNKGKAPDLLSQDTQINISKMKQSGYALQNFAAFVDLSKDCDPLESALLMADLFYQQLESHSDLISPVTSWEEIRQNMVSGKMSALLSLEEGGICKGNPHFLSVLYRLGARMMTLTWNYENELGFPNSDMKHGLKEQGFYFLEEMERLGMIIDVSHLSDLGIFDVLKHTKKPFVASHSNARSICPVMRNLTDNMIRQMAERGCITGLNFCKDFLGKPDPEKDYLDQAVKQISYLMNLGGEDFVGLGSDFDGIPIYEDFKDCTVMQTLIDRMEQAGFTNRQIEKICYKNVFRIYRELL